MYSYVKLMNESFDKRLYNESVGSDVAKYQRWVDYDMERYHKISDKTMDEIKKAGLSVVKDQYGEYEVIAHDPIIESNQRILEESDFSIEHAKDIFIKVYETLLFGALEDDEIMQDLRYLVNIYRRFTHKPVPINIEDAFEDVPEEAIKQFWDKYLYQYDDKESLTENIDIKQSLIDLFDKEGYDTDADDVKEYIDAAKEYIDMVQSDDGRYYSVDAWYKDTQENYPEDLQGLTLKECLSLQEAINMENEPDNKVLRGILLSRGNKKLSREEQEVLEKYNLEAIDNSSTKKLVSKDTGRILFAYVVNITTRRGYWRIMVQYPNSTQRAVYETDSRSREELENYISKLDIIGLLSTDGRESDSYHNYNKLKRGFNYKSFKNAVDHNEDTIKKLEAKIAENEEEIDKIDRLLPTIPLNSEERTRLFLRRLDLRQDVKDGYYWLKHFRDSTERLRYDYILKDVDDFAKRRYEGDTTNDLISRYKGLKKDKEKAAEEVEDAESIINEAPGGPIVNLRKYGWVTSPEENFSDDGAYFTVYRYYPEGKTDKESNFRLTRTNYQDDTYISIRYYNPATGKNVYIDDLNGVPRAEAVEKFPKVMEKVKALYDKENSEEGPDVRNLSDEEVEKINNLVKQIVSLTDASVQSAYAQAVKKIGLNKDDIPQSTEREIVKSIEDEFRNARSYDNDVIKKLAAEYLKSVIAQMRNGYDSKGRWKQGYDLDRALKHSYASVSNPAKPGNYIYLSDLPDNIQQNIKNWARERIETLYDFDIES